MSATGTRKATVAALVLALSSCVQPGQVPTPDEGKVPGDVLTALEALPRAEVVQTNSLGIPQFVRGELWNVNRRIDVAQAEAELTPAVDMIAPVFRLQGADLSLRDAVAEADGRIHARYQQVKGGLDVVGGDLIMHVDAEGTVYAVNGAAFGDDTISATPSIDGAAAVAAARAASPGLTLDSAHLVWVIATSDGSLH